MSIRNNFTIIFPRAFRFFAVGSAIFIGVCLSALPAVAQERPAEAPVLRVGVTPVFPPMVFKQGKELVGVEVDLARAFGEMFGRKVVFVELPWEDQIEAVNSGRTDIIMSGMSVTLPRKYVVDFSKPYMVIAQMTLVRRDDKGKYALGFPIKPPGTIGVLKATTGEFLVQHEFPKTSRKAFTTETQAVEALKKKKIDLFISDSPIIWYLAGTHAADGLAAVPIGLTEEQLAWGVKKGNDKLVTLANVFIQKAIEDGTFTKIYRRWMAVEQ